jgi:ATP-dependent exoDNAse (exonuclease V) alpha subunit
MLLHLETVLQHDGCLSAHATCSIEDGQLPIQQAIDRLLLITPPLAALDPAVLQYRLTSDQELVFQQLSMLPTGLHVLSGGPGCGKTFLTHVLTRTFRAAGKHVMLLGSTGVSASRLDSTATTVHAACSMGRAGTVFWTPLSVVSPQYHAMLHADVIIIDEISMLPSDVFNMFMLKIEGVLRNEQVGDTCPLHNKLIILVGDLQQLPPVCKQHRLQAAPYCKTCHITGTAWWQQRVQHDLHTNVRHADDPDFLRFLNMVRQCVPSEDQIQRCLQQCVVSETEALHILDADATFICSHRADVHRYNNTMAAHLFPTSLQVVGVRCTADAALLQHADVQAQLQQPDFHTLTHVAQGARVVLTANLDLANGACNGAIGQVTSVHHNSAGVLYRITMVLAHNNHTINVYRSKHRTRYVELHAYSMHTFPLMLAYAITGHRCQGATFHTPVILHVRSTDWCPGLMYVMLSRVTNRRLLKIVGALTPAMFVPMLV